MFRLALMGVVVPALAGFLTGCDSASGRNPGPDVASAHMDSIFPIEEEIRRFRIGLTPVDSLTHAVSSREELVSLFLDALARDDAGALGRLAMTVEEFAYLYYPESPYTRRPYELSPALVWFQFENYGSRGLGRARARFGGRELGARGHECLPEPEVEGLNLLWRECYAVLEGEGGERTLVSLFGAILEREGRFKFVNYGNRL